MLEKTMHINYLYDFYQSLLTDKQRRYMSLYYLDDYSLGEIADEFGVSRQAVYDNLKRTETMLEEFEEKLSLFAKYQKRKQLLEQMKCFLREQTPSMHKEALVILESLEKLD